MYSLIDIKKNMNSSNFHLALKSTQEKLNASGKEFVEFFSHGSLVVELYKPDGVDKQTPHTRDEVYLIAAGSGRFFNAGTYIDFSPGDFLFVPAGAEHRFVDFTDDFVTWVFFYGPEGGE
ncbi:MAG: Cupin domain protein [Chlorobi bacterium OLB5]|nr:MAG: Cupin domain protein [Chlorobi bacterium OLB5]